MNPKEIWANIGGSNARGKNHQFPPWAPALGADVPEGDYNKIMDALRPLLANQPHRQDCVADCSSLLCGATLGILSCPWCYLKMKIHKFNAKLKELPGSLGLTGVRIELTEGGYEENWVDSEGQPLMLRFRPRGPPWGYNVIFTLPASLSWPPNGAPGQHMMAAPATAVVIGAQDVAQKIMSLKQLLDAGALTQEEFDAKKQQLMDQMWGFPHVDSLGLEGHLECQELERATAEKREQQAFIASIIEEKQRQCQQAKEQHQEKIRALAHQARRASRARKAAGTRGSGGAIPVASGVAPAGPPGAAQAATLDLALLDKALGEKRRRQLLGGQADEGVAVTRACDAACLDSLKQALERRLELLQGMNARLRQALGPAGQPGGGPLVGGTEEFARLEREVAVLLSPDVAV
ncbi:unnamed protein product [Prorocentrum cordatum]|uniref:SHOCT domain-containing protein n=1 Tax=Prorocentrum cordatum TaxID=2364126 RepID=A0ABN9YAD2_9DINO|nr:unnamed protein product [Polarella glacialis]